MRFLRLSLLLFYSSFNISKASNLAIISPSSSDESTTRHLYDTFPVSNGEYRIKSVLKNITEPSGIALGYYKGNYGVFISSTSHLAIYFYNDQQFHYQLVAGVPYNSGNQDGQMLFSLFSSPTRMCYDQNTNRLYVAEKSNGIIRILDFNSDQVQTLYYYSNEDQQLSLLQFQNSVQNGGDFPGLDIQYSNSVLYVVDTIDLYQLSSIHMIGGVNIATVQRYTSLSDYMNIHGYPIDENLRSCVYSVAPDEKRKVLYVSISYAKNVILKVPMNPNEPYDKIIVLLGDEQLLFQGNVIGSPPPMTRNGNINTVIPGLDGSTTTGASNIWLSFPLHLRLSYLGDILYFSEGYPTTSDGQYLFGSLTIRRYKLTTGEVDTYGGLDFSNNPFNESHYNLIGSLGGYHDNDISSSQFKYPMSIGIVPTDSELNSKDDKNKNQNENIFHIIYIADHTNGAVRKIFPIMYTSTPTPAPTNKYPPSCQPTLSPTITSDFSSSVSSFYSNLQYYQQILFITSMILLGCVCCFFCVSCCILSDSVCCSSSSSSSDISEHGDLESSKSGLFQTPKSSNFKDYMIQSWKHIRDTFEDHSLSHSHSRSHSPLHENRHYSNGSDDGRNGLLDVSISSSTSSLENDEWNDVIWNRTPNLNISKQYRMSESKWPKLSLRFNDHFHPKSDTSRSSKISESIRTDSTIAWSTITPMALRQQQSGLDDSNEFVETIVEAGASHSHPESDSLDVSYDEENWEGSKRSNQHDHDQDHQNYDRQDDQQQQQHQDHNQGQNNPPSLIKRLTSWLFEIPSLHEEMDDDHSTHEIQLNERQLRTQSSMSSNNSSGSGGNGNGNEETGKTPKNVTKKWNSSKWDQVDETVVTLQFDD